MTKDYMADFWNGLNNTTQMIDNLKNEPIKRSASQILLENAQIKLEDDLKLRNLKISEAREKLMNSASALNLEHSNREENKDLHQLDYQTNLENSIATNQLGKTQKDQDRELLNAMKSLRFLNKETEYESDTAQKELLKQTSEFNHEDNAITRPYTKEMATTQAQTGLTNAKSGQIKAVGENAEAGDLYGIQIKTRQDRMNNALVGQEVKNLEAEKAKENINNELLQSRQTGIQNHLSLQITGLDYQGQLNYLKDLIENPEIDKETKLSASVLKRQMEENKTTADEVVKKNEIKKKSLSILANPQHYALSEMGFKQVIDKNTQKPLVRDGKYVFNTMIPIQGADGKTYVQESEIEYSPAELAYLSLLHAGANDLADNYLKMMKLDAEIKANALKTQNPFYLIPPSGK